MKKQLFKTCFLAAAMSLFYACAPDEQEVAELDAISHSDNSSSMICDEITFENNVSRDANGFVTSVASTGGKTVGIMGVRRSYIYPFMTYEATNRANLFNTNGTQAPYPSDDTDLIQAETGNVLIVNHGDNAAITDDFARGAKMTVDFSSIGSVTLTSLTVLDNEEADSKAIVYLQNGSTQTFDYPMTGDGGVETLLFGANGTSNVVSLEVILGKEGVRVGSGAIDNIKFCYGSPEFGCTRTQGYWKTHSKYDGSKKQDNNWNNLEDVTFFGSNTTYYNIMGLPVKGYGYYNLAHQYIAAKLNQEQASMPQDVYTAFTAATALFSTKGSGTGGFITPDEMKANSTLNAEAIRLAGILDAYNNGKTGPGHCD